MGGVGYHLLDYSSINKRHAILWSVNEGSRYGLFLSVRN